MENPKQKLIVIGAGLTGLVLAHTAAKNYEATLYDKARGVGGRMATRRTEAARFDHGAQFYSLKEPVKELHDRWMKRGLVKHWFNTDDGVERYCAKDGMTALAKDLANDVNVILNERLVSIDKVDWQWRTHFESGREASADRLVITAPVPQALEILTRSQIKFAPKLNEIIYTKALVVLFEASPIAFAGNKFGYLEPDQKTLFSIADQNAKGVSRIGALTVTLSPNESERLYDASDDEITSFTIAELRRLSPSFEPGKAQVKKWRYCQVQKSYGELYLEVAPGLILAGDEFGGPSLNGAIRSADAVINFLKQSTS